MHNQPGIERWSEALRQNPTETAAFRSANGKVGTVGGILAYGVLAVTVTTLVAASLGLSKALAAGGDAFAVGGFQVGDCYVANVGFSSHLKDDGTTSGRITVTIAESSIQ